MSKLAREKRLTWSAPAHIIQARMFLKCAPAFYFYPHFTKRNPSRAVYAMPPRPCGVPGDGRGRQQGTGLLNIAGEKIGGSGTLGHASDGLSVQRQPSGQPVGLSFFNCSFPTQQDAFFVLPAESVPKAAPASHRASAASVDIIQKQRPPHRRSDTAYAALFLFAAAQSNRAQGSSGN